jgi:hypothetical protein
MNLDRAAREAVRKRRRRLLINVLEVALGDLVELDGIEATKRAIDKFRQQLEDY